ncbi:MAG: sensor histidine kinase [Kineosporiaceae bacterium]
MTVTAPDGAPRLSADELADLFLFESLSAGQRQWLADRGWVVEVSAGAAVYREGEPAEVFVVLLDGEIRLFRRVRDTDVDLVRSAHRGAYAGATQAYVSGLTDQRYSNSMTAIADSRFFVLGAAEFAEAVREWFPMAVHLLEGLFFGLRNSDAVVGQRERLIALGQLSAGLTHELNNPAAAAVRATARLRERVAAMRHKLATLAGGAVAPDTLRAMTTLQERAVAGIAAAPRLTPMEASDAEDAVGDWLEGHEVGGAWDLAPVLVQAGVADAYLEDVAAAIPGAHLDGGIRWIVYSLETELLMNEIDEATSRISSLVAASKQYSQLDRAPYQETDVHDGIESTLVMLTSKLDGVRVERDYDRDLPRVPAYPAELNQVWTNLVDNAVDAMGGSGALTVRTFRQDRYVVVEIIDTGPGVPEDLRRRIFEPFFTTKPVGQGTGLGLDISRRIVVERHRGDLRLESRPGDTRFQAVLPIELAGRSPE